jgi:hypothetical protein
MWSVRRPQIPVVWDTFYVPFYGFASAYFPGYTSSNQYLVVTMSPKKLTEGYDVQLNCSYRLPTSRQRAEETKMKWYRNDVELGSERRINEGEFAIQILNHRLSKSDNGIVYLCVVTSGNDVYFASKVLEVKPFGKYKQLFLSWQAIQAYLVQSAWLGSATGQFSYYIARIYVQFNQVGSMIPNDLYAVNGDILILQSACSTIGAYS